MSVPERVGTFLGFAKKSGHLLTGEKAVATGIKTGKAKIVLMATDLPERRRFFCIKFCEEQKIPYSVVGTKEEYGQILGMSPRTLLAVTEQKIAEQIQKTLALIKEDG